MITNPPTATGPPHGAQDKVPSSAPPLTPERDLVTRLGPAAPSLFTLFVVALITVLAIAPLWPRSIAPASAPSDVFSAERALPHLQAIAQRPHPVGTLENRSVRDYLLLQISTLGLEPQVQRTAMLTPRDGGAIVDNVLIRLPGTASTRTVLLVAHYDSVVGAPGVGDNGMSVAAMVETLRALRAGPSLRNDLIFLLDDGEEAGKLGSVAFIQEHPWARDVGLVFDFDADGPMGPTTLMWTTRGDGWLVGEIARAGAGLLAASSENPGKRAEFGNDLHVFAAAGYRGAYFDRVGGSTYHHSPRDKLANLDLASLQRQGDAVLALARHFANLSFAEMRADDAVFFTAFG